MFFNIVKTLAHISWKFINTTSENTELWLMKSTGAVIYANLNAQRDKMRRNEFECWNNGIAQSHHHSLLNWMTVVQTCCIFCECERHKFRFDWRQCKFECWENEIEWRIGCAWPKSSKLNDRKINLVDKITKLTGKTYIIIKYDHCAFEWYIFEIPPVMHHWAALYKKLNVKICATLR